MHVILHKPEGYSKKHEYQSWINSIVKQKLGSATFVTDKKRPWDRSLRVSLSKINGTTITCYVRNIQPLSPEQMFGKWYNTTVSEKEQKS